MSAQPSDEIEIKADWPVWAGPVLDCMKKEPNIKRAAQAVGIARSTIQRLINRDESFASAIHNAREFALDEIEQEVRDRAKGYMQETKVVVIDFPDGRRQTITTKEHIRSDTLLIFYLKTYRTEFRHEKRIELTGIDGGAIEIEERLSGLRRSFRDGVLRLVESGEEGAASS